MLIKTILNKVHKLKSFVYQDVKQGFHQGAEVFNVTVVPRKNSPIICSGCQKPAPGYDHLTRWRFELVLLWGIRVFLLYRMRRVQCKRCGVKVEQVPWAGGKKELTKAYGFRTYRCAEIALYHALGKLPEPEMLHRFC